MHTIRILWLGVAAAGALFYLDTPRRTFGQSFRANRWRARIAFLVIEVAFVALWSMARLAWGAEFALFPESFAVGAAIVGLLISAAGVGLAVWAKLRLGRWFSATFAIKEGHELVTDGPYAVTRHPIYTGILATLAGGALVWNSGLTLLLAGMMTAPFFLHTVVEEAVFEQHFGESYSAYQRRVPRMVPFARRASRS